MKIISKTPQKSLDKGLLRFLPKAAEFDSFKAAFSTLLAKIDNTEREDNQKTHIHDFLRDAFYRGTNEINSKGAIDLVVHLGADKSSSVVLIVEAKNPGNKGEMLSEAKPNAKALHELILYYMRERIEAKNDEVKYLIATNINEWFIFSASDFDEIFHRNTKFRKKYEDWRDNQLVNSNTDHFYNEIAKPFVADLEKTLECTHFDLREYAKPSSDKKLIALYKLLSPYHLLKTKFQDDSNRLDKDFYKELLHIIGLEEYKEKSKTLIQRKTTDNTGSLMEMAVTMLEVKDVLPRVENPSAYGDTREKRYETIALELCITWINRILFLKLLEAQLVGYHENDKAYRFLNLEMVRDFDELFALFHQVLAKTADERQTAIRDKFTRIPYLNSSLFEATDLENQTITIESLKDHELLPVISTSILRKLGEKAHRLPTLEYLFRFLDAYDFASEGKDDIQSENRALINASVLGKVFEKINGYKDGSIYTPGFITMYMCRQAIRLAVVQKFKAETDFDGADFDELKNYVGKPTKKTDILRYNEIIDSLKICDPAVGSGHFLVSALNEILTIKSELNLFADEAGVRFAGIEIAVAKDELVVTDDENVPFEYKIRDGRPLNAEMQRLQSTLFHEKQKLIENCLFGVDINPNSVKICRLRLWIELLKNAYYKDSELETLPNIDINIKEGNSLISRYRIDGKFKSEATNKHIAEYRAFTDEAKNVKDKVRKEELKLLIRNLHKALSGSLDDETTEIIAKKTKKEQHLFQLNSPELFEKHTEYGRETKTKKLTEEITRLDAELAKIENKYSDAFEWRFEFPEVLDEDGAFLGFDAVIGNPPYVYRNYEYEELKNYFDTNYESTEGNFDLYKFFAERSISICSTGGYVSLIISNTFLTGKSFDKLRRVIYENSHVLEIFDLGEHVFDGITVENVLILLRKERPEHQVTGIKIQRTRHESISDLESSYELDLTEIFTSEGTFNIYLNEASNAFVKKLRTSTTELGKLTYCNVGINTGYIKAELTASGMLDSTYHKMLSGRDIGVNTAEWKGRWIKYDKDFVDSFGDRGRTLPPEFIFTNEKILVQRTRRGMKRKLICYLDTDGFYNLNRLSNIVITDANYSLRYIHAILNSKLMDNYFNIVFNEYEVKPWHLSQLPTKIATFDEQTPFIAIVDQILDLKKSGGDTTDLENRIDEMVYDLYELTDDEKEIIRNSV